MTHFYIGDSCGRRASLRFERKAQVPTMEHRGGGAIRTLVK